MATFVALVSHVTGGGQMPGWLGVVVPLVLSVAVCTVLAGRRLSLWRMSLAVAVSQMCFHTLFVLGTFSPSAAAGESSSHHMHGSVPILMDDSAAATHLHAGASMWLMHGVAAVVTIAALYRGERTFNRLREIAVEFTRWARRRLSPVLIALPIAPAHPLVPVTVEQSRPVVSLLVFSVTRRGPPAVAVF
ncbi:hypothetical protein F6B41_01930 [Microbacterium lushaniae]|nr:hypothetical protein F6B41_08220 [Microbacterium lushaniae]KAA9159228.1 hypothetical protein F6B41_01930 [Microbacterium lushaniae]